MIQLIVILIVYIYLLRKFKKLNIQNKFLNYNNTDKFLICDEPLCI